MTKRLGQTPIYSLLAGSIRDDPTIRASALALDPERENLAQSLPNLLLWARLDPQSAQPGFLSPALQRMAVLAGGLKPLSLEELELLAWQLHVDFRDVARTKEQLAGMVRQSIPWHRIKGTSASIKRALALYGYTAAIEEDGTGQHWATYQLGLPEIADMDTVRHIVKICNEMAPVRCRLWRIYTDVFDKRPIVLSVGPKLGDGWLSFFSGVPLPGQDDADKDLIVSFGVRHGVQADPYLPEEVSGSFGTNIWLGFLAPYLDTFVVGRSRLGTVYPRNHGFAMTSLFSILWADRATTGRGWRGTWDARRWLDYTSFDRKLPPWKMRSRQTSHAQLVPGWGEALGDTNARLGATFATVIDNPPRLGSFVLSGHNCQRRELRLHEMFVNRIPLIMPALQPSSFGIAGMTRQSTGGSSASLLFREATGWTGKWNKRSWRGNNTFIQTAITDYIKE